MEDRSVIHTLDYFSTTEKHFELVFFFFGDTLKPTNSSTVLYFMGAVQFNCFPTQTWLWYLRAEKHSDFEAHPKL